MATGTRTLTLGPEDHGRAVSSEDFASAEFKEPWIYERSGGRLIVMAPEGTGHVRASNPWRDRLILYKYENPGIIEEVVGQAWVRPDDDTDRIGDIGVYLTGRELQIPENAPELMFEIVSPGKVSRNRDYLDKRGDYFRLGIREYVIVDRFARTVTVLILGDQDYEERVLTIADTYTTPRPPGFSVRLAEVF